MGEEESCQVQVVIISGLSGSGKSVALNLLEDNGYSCTDNLPTLLLPVLTNHLRHVGRTQAAVSIDARSADTLPLLKLHLKDLYAAGIQVHFLFLEAKTPILVKRYSETRRRHPLSDGNRTLTECIELEREMLAEIAELAHRIDTSDLSANQLRSWVRQFIQSRSAGIQVVFQSFGFKHGLPLDADAVFDARCLPNPYYEPHLRPLTGKDELVQNFLNHEPLVEKMIADIRRYLTTWLPEFVRDNRSYFSVAIGCTGGQHRSVYLAEMLAAEFRQQYPVLLRHRELEG